MAHSLPQSLIARMRGVLSEAPTELQPLWTVAAAIFLKREEPRWNALNEDAFLLEDRFHQFLACPSSYDLVMEMLTEEGEGGAPANNAGGGAIAGLGVPAAPGMSTNPNFAEPPVDLRKKKKRPEILTRAAMTQTESVYDGAKQYCSLCDKLVFDNGRKVTNEPLEDQEIWKYGELQYIEVAHLSCAKKAGWKLHESIEPSDTFAGADVFDVDMDTIHNTRFGKNRYHRWSKYVGEDEVGLAIRDHAKSTKNDIILKDQTTGTMSYLRKRRV